MNAKTARRGNRAKKLPIIIDAELVPLEDMPSPDGGPEAVNGKVSPGITTNMGGVSNPLPLEEDLGRADEPDGPVFYAGIEKNGATRATRATNLNVKGKDGSTDPSALVLPVLPDADAAADDDLLDGATNPATDPPPVDAALEEPPALEECPCWRVYLDWWKDGKNRRRPGVYWHSLDDEDGTQRRIDEWLCGPILIEAVTADRRGVSYGRLLRVRDVRGHWHAWNMPMSMLKGSCEELRGELLDMGLEVDHKAFRNRLPQYLMHKPPKRNVIAARSVGWHGAAFVLPDEVFGEVDVWYQSEAATVAEFDQSGTLDEWRGQVAALAPGNWPLTLAISAACAGPLMALAHVEGCGLHLVGDSSGGKTTSVQAAQSVWGGPGGLRTWRATSNGLEGAASESNDTLLVLDEIGEADGKEVGAVVYAIANGRGKTRANRQGYARTVARWRTVLLSTGEKSLEAHMSEAGKQVRAGQGVRLLNIPVGGRFGAFDDLHGRDSGRAFADEIKTACALHYGTAGRALLRYLVDRSTEDYAELLARYTARFQADSGQEGRAARQLALVALAGELATKAGITGWPPGTALAAARTAFDRWRADRGTGNAEDTRILQGIRDFIGAHGDARFSRLHDTERLVRDRAGYTEAGADGREAFLFLPAALREAVPGYDGRRILTALRTADWLIGGGRVQRKVVGINTNLYGVILPDEPQEGPA